MIQTVILAGGKGTRLASRLNGQPKPLVMIDGIPLLQRQIESLKEFGVDRIVLLVNHKQEKIDDFIALHNGFGIDIKLIDDGEPRGTGGALLSVLDQLDDEFLVVYGDTLFNLDIDKFVRSHKSNKGCATLLVHPNDHPEDSDLIDVNLDGRVLGFHPYPHPKGSSLPNVVNAAMYVLSKPELEDLGAHLPRFCDLAKHVFPKMLELGKHLHAYNTPEYIKDVGTPARIDRVEAHIASGKFALQGYSHKQPAIFIDRDGTLNVPAGHINHPDQLEIFEDVPEAMLALQSAQFRTVLISNQPVVARGEASLEDIKAINAKLDNQLSKSGSFLDAKFMCFHYPEAGFEGEVVALKITCECRKPAPGLIFEAQKELNIDLSKSWFIGDTEMDFGAAFNAGVASIGVRTGGEVNKVDTVFEPDILLDTFSDATNVVTGKYPQMLPPLLAHKNLLKSSRDINIEGSDLEYVEIVRTAIYREIIGMKFRPEKHVARKSDLKYSALISNHGAPSGSSSTKIEIQTGDANLRVRKA